MIDGASEGYIFDWANQGPKPIHIYHDILWESNYFEHLYQICQKVMIPIYETIFESRPPGMFEEAMDDLRRLDNWFGEEYFTYIRVWGSLSHPHVLHLYVPNKLVSTEVVY